MSDKPQSEGQNSDTTPAGVTRKPKNAPPSFDDILASAGEKKPEPVQAKTEPKVEKKPAGPPSFDDILAKAKAPPPAKAERAERPERGERPQRPQGPRTDKKEEFKMPVVVRKIALPPKDGEKPAEGAEPKKEDRNTWRRDRSGDRERHQKRAQPEGGEAQGAGEHGERAERPERSGGGEMPESVYAQPSSEETGDFAALFAAEQAKKPKRERLHLGSKVQAKVAHIGAEVAFLDLGGKGEGIIDLRELRNEAGELTAHEGDAIEGWVLSVGEGSVVVTRSVPKGAGRELLQTAMDAGMAVDGLVTAVNKGGLEVDLGGTRAFCPASQIDVRFVGDTATFVGQRLKFKVVEMKGGNAILSRRALLEVERAEQAKKLRETLAVGQSLEGVVVGVRDFGAFVDLGGIEGLVHVSELSHARVAHAQDIVKVGQKVRVQVLRIEPAAKKGETEKVALSLKALEQDPWDAARPQLEVNAKLQGKVARLQPFGAFVELFPGVDGLVHVSALSDKRINHPREVVKEGETIWVQIESIDDQSKRVALRKITEEEAQSADPVPPRAGHARHEGGERGGRPQQGGAPQKRSRVGDVVDATVEKVETFGVFVSWDGGQQKGLVPNGELGTPRGSDNKKTNPVGSQFKAYITDLDDRGRFRLSKQAAEAALDRQEYETYQRNAKKAAGKGFGTLGDLLRAKLAQKE
ncbi:MAG: S1 RNA-binding domain-containing protein [Deltaproteobacteria bacterium]|nr:S1 RNA-binding domain-containing protein [Deltaproteobacteria bacterium]